MSGDQENSAAVGADEARRRDMLALELGSAMAKLRAGTWVPNDHERANAAELIAELDRQPDQVGEDGKPSAVWRMDRVANVYRVLDRLTTTEGLREPRSTIFGAMLQLLAFHLGERGYRTYASYGPEREAERRTLQGWHSPKLDAIEQRLRECHEVFAAMCEVDRTER